MTHAHPGSFEQRTSATTPQPNLEDLAIDAVLHLGAALDVLDLHARHNITAINCVCRDLLRIYYAKADQAQSLEPQDKELLGLLYDTAVNLGYAIEVVDHLNGDEADDPILYAVSYLLKAAKRFADEGVAAALAVKG
ncbi:Uncharacterised protein [Delftia tsuruhatensis]|uniref:hypothetical protein n=1 Tax=Delftia tsuruhatensis TaxID=180282 RepID=UPI001E6C772B|nr:hypothetical protein [Delftia tsuruhatensis]CAB5714582.1 Uncharacterised protein [Delftia tsuruhatensis]CAC9689123.1 Uncharacterised protein [Delftia tsuruhatensis]